LHFTDKLYKTNNWVAGCKFLNKYFCWPCLLFSVEQNVWSKDGFQFDLPNLRKRNKCRVNQEVDIETTYRRIFIEIIDNIKEEINIRFNSLDDIIFRQFLDTT